MKIVFTAKGTTWEDAMDPRFGRADYLLVFDEESKELSVVDNREQSQQEHGAGPRTAQKVIDVKPDIVITGNGPGGNASRALEAATLDMYVGAGEMSIKEAYDAFKAGKLDKA
ncbi:MAG: dinitrogenase iron-molybdenum cofactor biosynthesis protein [Spirochaetes bacterium]|nr:MAG: dinitrogenase iron-molybdenum cofactor biosynthesis protein [Spirochaetota bacterium]RKX73866.1 MAG: dinitrogenase iron-molybdenum cofactor biosynthesis protein [Spirochaetota bacterium]RKX85728.1 MAG: dinitrogenase iron-molybdenum cofactor biosynthesis protein [Spirochaetota bacterium]RKX96793.1 MAG: dinitrogenase iron-molybdenum cofactor biosynthesis protein [Spirochaetota bacterium]